MNTKKLYILLLLILPFSTICGQSTMMVIHREYGVKDSILIDWIDKITFHQSALTGLATDIDGNIYRTVIIGNKEWLVENLRVSHLNDGTPIPNITSSDQWTGTISPGLCSYNNVWGNRLKYGLLYNGFAVETGKLAPVGWRVTKGSDWLELEEYFGSGINLYRAVFQYQEQYSGYADSVNNSSGLSLIRFGNRASPDNFYPGHADFWLQRETESDPVVIRFGLGNYGLGEWPSYDWFGISVRCVRDL